jgi:hypothetical protein
MPVINVLDKGCKCDGVTDDGLALYTIFSEANDRDIILFPPGHTTVIANSVRCIFSKQSISVQATDHVFDIKGPTSFLFEGEPGPAAALDKVGEKNDKDVKKKVGSSAFPFYLAEGADEFLAHAKPGDFVKIGSSMDWSCFAELLYCDPARKLIAIDRPPLGNPFKIRDTPPLPDPNFNPGFINGVQVISRNRIKWTGGLFHIEHRGDKNEGAPTHKRARGILTFDKLVSPLVQDIEIVTDYTTMTREPDTSFVVGVSFSLCFNSTIRDSAIRRVQYAVSIYSSESTFIENCEFRMSRHFIDTSESGFWLWWENEEKTRYWQIHPWADLKENAPNKIFNAAWRGACTKIMCKNCKITGIQLSSNGHYAWNSSLVLSQCHCEDVWCNSTALTPWSSCFGMNRSRNFLAKDCTFYKCVQPINEFEYGKYQGESAVFQGCNFRRCGNPLGRTGVTAAHFKDCWIETGVLSLEPFVSDDIWGYGEPRIEQFGSMPYTQTFENCTIRFFSEVPVHTWKNNLLFLVRNSIDHCEIRFIGQTTVYVDIGVIEDPKQVALVYAYSPGQEASVHFENVTVFDKSQRFTLVTTQGVPSIPHSYKLLGRMTINGNSMSNDAEEPITIDMTCEGAIVYLFKVRGLDTGSRSIVLFHSRVPKHTLPRTLLTQWSDMGHKFLVTAMTSSFKFKSSSTMTIDDLFQVPMVYGAESSSHFTSYSQFLSSLRQDWDMSARIKWD